MLATFLIFVVVACLAFCWYQWKMARLYRSFPSKRLDIDWLLRILVGRYPKGVTFTQFVFQEMLKTINSFREKGLCVVWIGQPKVLVFDEKFMKHLVNEADLSDRGPFIEVNKILFGNGLFGSKHDVWKVHRRLINPSFNLSMMKGSLSSLNKYARKLVKEIETFVDKPTEDSLEALKWASINSMTDFLLGIPESETIQDLAKVGKEMVERAEHMVLERIYRPWLHMDFLLPFFKSGKEYLKFVDEANDIIQRLIHELKKEDLKDEFQATKSCGSVILKLHLKDRVFSMKDVQDHVLAISSAGYDTIAVTMMWCLYVLGHHPEAQEKAYNEVASIAPDGDITYEDLSEMKYLECVIKETMRLFSIVPTVSRVANRDIKCGQYTIPKGADVWFFIFMLHRDPNVFPEPEKFDPDRFSDASKLRPWMYIPFAEGYRNCIGKRFAMLEMKVQLAHILRRFKITSLNKIDDSELENAMVLLPTKHPRLLFENRLQTA